MRKACLKTALLLLLLIWVKYSLVAQDTSVVTPAAYSNASNLGGIVRNWGAIKPETNPNNITTGSSIQDFPLVTQYLDGLGRPVQTVVKQGALATGTTAYDMLTAQVYDEYGRQARMYLPFAGTASTGNFQTNPFQQQNTFYSGTGSPVYGQGETYYYGKTEFEESPLNRTTKTFAAGDNWVHGGKGIEMHYWHNTAADSVRIWTVTDINGSFGSYNTTRYYAAGTLFKQIVIDERNNRVVEYKDKQGKTILKKVQLTAQADTGQGKGHYGWLCTYFVYDVAGQLRATIQPAGVDLLAQHSWDITWNGNVILNEQCFRYEYNERGLPYMKKTPGAGAVYIVYDNRDRLVFSQDSIMRSSNKWFTTLYNALNRPVITGLTTYNVSRDSLQALVTAQTTAHSIPLHNVVSGSGHTGNKQALLTATLYDEFESATSGEMTAEIVDGTIGAESDTIVIGGIAINRYPVPAAATFNPLAYAFYDNYDWLPVHNNPVGNTRSAAWDTHLLTASNSTFPYPQSVTQSKLLTGLATGTAVKNLSNDSLLYTVNFYDDEGRAVQTQGKNITGDTSIVSTQYSFTGQPLIVISKSGKGGANAQTTVTVTKFTYDSLGRVIKTEKKLSNTLVNGGALSGWITLSTLSYDVLGQVKKKIIAPAGGAGGVPLDSMTYDYNIRGWLLGANRAFVKDTLSTANFFGYDLGYDKTVFAINGSSKNYNAPQYNGNITGQLWKSTGDGQVRRYDYTYDALNRLVNADFTQFTNNAFSLSAGIDFSVKMAGYDANGNILGMMQKGWKPGGSVTIDSLLYTYYSYTNRLQNVIDVVNDTATRLGDFRSSKAYINSFGPSGKTSAATDYSYDGNGNLVRDLNKDIAQAAGNGIVYNHLNLPQTIYVSVKGKIEFVYDAAGYRLKKITTDSTVTPVKVTTTLYDGGAVYVNDTLQFLGQEEGRIRFDITRAAFFYDYFIKDHLGNVRMVLTGQKDTAFYPAVTFEGATVANESIYYDSVYLERTNRPGNFYDTTTNGHWVQLLRKSTHSIGVGKLLKVMARDRVHVKVDYYLPDDATDNSNANGLNSIVAVLANLVNSASPTFHGVGSTIASDLNSSVPFTDFLAPQSGGGGSMPKAYLNILFFDEQFRFVSANSEMVQVSTKGSGQTIYRIDGNAKEAARNGYVYIYVSNESNNLVYFDNLQVTHEKGPITQETHYYPFGLTIAAISSKAMGGMENSYKFNAGTELNNDLGIAMYETAFRGYDAQTGRFTQVDPLADSYADWSAYVFAFNDPVYWNDPAGLEPNDYGGRYTYENGVWMYMPFSSSEEAFLYGAQYASTWDMWGSYYGMAGSFDEAWLRYNGGFLTSGMAAAYFSMLWGAQVSGLGAGYADGGYNLSYTATLTGNTYGGLFFSMDYISDGIDRMMDVDRNKAPRGGDMSNPWDWLYQWNNMFNFVAPFANAGSTYITGYDTYGVAQSNTQATAGMLLVVLPGGKVASASSTAGSLWKVGAYTELRSLGTGLDAHHVGQKKLMEKFVPGYDYKTAPSILVPKPGHTIGAGVVSRNMSGFSNAREVLARDIFELRRVYGPQGIPNSALQELIQMNKTMYPGAFTK
ncbi:DUF6443 domain-containing protein [Niastella populi]|uniref:DUF6443 domain-containing protein n=1 Tax=Niastella populi TaxID=550983 RepID=A0A1V9G218_9BACT|nr:DUF6443 domain-containing protein [Niastella populi]OQP64630.1 hypothetical protein A4R26_16430 [Niastella populi]